MTAAVQAAERPEAAPDRRGIPVLLDRVAKRFGRTTVLNQLTLDIPAGQFIAIVGRSGSGKSSLLRMICGLDEPSGGSIRIGGAAPGGPSTRMMFQEPRLLPWARVLDNVTVGLPTGFPARQGANRAREALQAVGLDNRAADWPTLLSGGQKQRVALARALVSRPPLLLLDEPLGALDALTRLEMQVLIGRSWQEQGFTAVLVTHDVAEAVRLADRIVLIEDGTVALDVLNPTPHPRDARTPGTVALEDRILARLMRTG